MLVIPAIDLMDGQVVRLSRGDFATRIVYSDRPADFAKPPPASPVGPGGVPHHRRRHPGPAALAHHASAGRGSARGGGLAGRV